MMVASRTDPSRGMGTRLYTCRCVDLGSPKTSFLSVLRMQGPSMEARFTVGNSVNATTRRGELSTETSGLLRGFDDGLGGGDGGGLRATLGLLPFLQESLHLVHELADVLELPVHRGEADVSHLVELLEVLHHQVPELQARDLLPRPAAEALLYIGDHIVHGLHPHRPLLARLEDRGAQLLAVEGLAPAIPLDHHGEHVLDVLVGRVTAAALEALPAAADELSLPPHAGVHHPVLGVAAERALHRRRSG